MPEDIRTLGTEQRHPRSEGLDQLPPLAFVTLMNDIDSEVLPAVRAAAPAIAQAIEGATERLGRGGRIIYFGAGTSGRIGMLDAAECPPTFGVEPELVQAQLAGGPEAFQRAKEGVEDSPEAGAADVETLGVDETDVAVGIAASGRTPYVLGALRRAGELGALTVAIACVEGSAIGREAQVVIEVVTGPEILTGSTRLKAGTAQKMVLNMLSTGVMVQMGKVYENLMVDVKATNAKLRQRAVGIVREVTGEPDDRAQAALEACEWSVKPACLVAARGLSPAEASALLSRHGGRLREALRAPDHA